MERSPASTSIIRRSEIQARNIQLIDQALNLTAGVYPIRAKGMADSLAGVGMRGFSGRGAAQSRTLVLLDGQPINNAYTGGVVWAALPVNEIERVEVVRGPFSALYGGNAMAGVVNLLTRTYERRQFEVDGEYGSQNTMIYSGRYSDRFFNRLGVTLAYRRLQSGGYRNYPVLRSAHGSSASAGVPVTGVTPWLKPTGSPTFQVGMRGQNWWNQHSYRARVQYSFSSSTAVSVQLFRLTHQYGYDAGTTDLLNSAGAPVYNGTVVFQQDGIRRRIRLGESYFLNGPGGGESYLVQGQLHHAFSPTSRLQLLFGLLDNPSDWYVIPSRKSTFAGGGGKIARRPSRGYYGNAQMTLARSSHHNLVFGAESRQNKTDATDYELANYALRGTRLGQLSSAFGNAFNQAAYLQDQISLGPRFQIVMGGRYDYWKSYDGASTPAPGEQALHYPNRSSHSFNGKFSALYQLTEGTTVYGDVGSAFRNPTVFELYRTYRLSSGNLYLSNPNLVPERMFSWEGGLRQRITSRVRINASYFENYIHNLIYRTVDLGMDPAGKIRPLRNAAKGFTRGVEFGGRVQLRSWLQFRVSYAYNNAIIRKNPFKVATEGKRVPYVPKHFGSFGLLGAYHRISGSVTGRYVGSAYRSDTNTDVVNGVPGSYDPFFVMDLTASYRVNRHVTAYSSVENLFNRRYFVYYWNPGRLVSVGLRLQLP